MWNMIDETIEDLLPEIDLFSRGPVEQHPALWFEDMQEKVFAKGWERVGEGSFATGYTHFLRPDVLLKLYDWDHHDSIGRETYSTIDDADVIERLGDDPRCMQLVARHSLAVVVTRIPGEPLGRYMRNPELDEDEEDEDLIEEDLDFDTLTCQIADYIHFCLGKGIVPLDLSTANLFYKDGTLRFIDYAMYSRIEDFRERHPGKDPFAYAFYQAMIELG